MKNYKHGNNYKGEASTTVAEINQWVEVAENEAVYVTTDNERIVSDKAIEGALLLDNKPTDTAYNLDGIWVEPLEAKPEVSPETDTAFMRLIGAYSVAGSYPQKQSAMVTAVESLGEDATADELYKTAVANLG